MAIRATHVPSGTDISIGGPFVEPRSQAIIDEVYQNCAPGVLECREHDSDPRLAQMRDPADGRVHDAWVYLQRRYNKTRWVICHHPSGIGRDFQSHVIPVGKSDQHQWQQDYISRAAEDAGFAAEQEVILPTGTILDIKIDGIDGPVGFEVQHSFLSVPKVVARTRKAHREGIPLVWSADHKNPDWAFRVPHIEANGSPNGATPRRAWTVTTGPRRIISVACTPRNADLLDRCQKPRSRNWCGGRHPVFRPIEGLVVDDIAQRVPAGELVPLDTGLKQGVILVTATDRLLWENEFATKGQASRIMEPSTRNGSRAKRCVYPVPQTPAPRSALDDKIWQNYVRGYDQ